MRPNSLLARSRRGHAARAILPSLFGLFAFLLLAFVASVLISAPRYRLAPEARPCTDTPGITYTGHPSRPMLCDDYGSGRLIPDPY